MEDAASGAAVPPLVRAAVGPHALVHDGTDASRERGFLEGLPVTGSDTVVLLAGGAYRRPGLAAELTAVLRDLLATRAETTTTVWLAITDIAALGERLRVLADESGVALVAPSGGMRFAVGSGIHTGPAVGGGGWIRFDPGGAPPSPYGTRYPRPAWEDALPSDPAADAEVRAEPVPAGIAVRSAAADEMDPDDLALRAVLDRRTAQIVVGSSGPVPPPSVAARVLRALPPGADPLVVPGVASVAGYPWTAGLAAALGRDVRVATGVRLRPAGAAPGSAAETLVPDRVAEPSLRPFPTVLRQYPDGTQTVVAVADPPPGWGRHDDHSYVSRDVGATVVPSGLVLSRRRAGPLPVAPFDPAGWTLHLGRPDEPVDGALLAAAVALRGALDDTRRARCHGRLGGRWATPDAADEAVRLGLVPAAPPTEWDTGIPDIRLESGEPAAPAAPGARADGVDAAEPEPVAPSEADALVVPDRASTAAEQQGFVESAGGAYTEALSVVNAAIATWPGLRRDGSGAKVDLAAVCLHLGRGERGASRVNPAVRSGGHDLPAGQVACLTSGLRMLPTHRRAVLRQGPAGGPPDEHATPGRVLTEPGFLSASADLDVTVPDAGYDVLIWPSTARRTAELVADRPIAEAVFPAGARFRTLGVRDTPEPDPAVEHPVPRLALLVRELGADENGAEEDGVGERDQAAIGRLERVLTRRRQTAPRLVDDPDVVERLTTPLVTARPGYAPAAGGMSAAAS